MLFPSPPLPRRNLHLSLPYSIPFSSSTVVVALLRFTSLLREKRVRRREEGGRRGGSRTRSLSGPEIRAGKGEQPRGAARAPGGDSPGRAGSHFGYEIGRGGRVCSTYLSGGLERSEVASIEGRRKKERTKEREREKGEEERERSKEEREELFTPVAMAPLLQ